VYLKLWQKTTNEIQIHNEVIENACLEQLALQPRRRGGFERSGKMKIGGRASDPTAVISRSPLKAAGFAGACLTHGREALHRFEWNGIEPVAPRLHMRNNVVAHSRIPEFAQMLRRAFNGVGMPLTYEELSDLIGHFHELLGRAMRHGKRPA
jgi:hypothetical protein